MDQLDVWHQQVRDGKIDNTLHAEIANKILDILNKSKESQNATQYFLLAQAIAGLSINVNSTDRPAGSGLIKCLIALRKATISGNYPVESDPNSNDLREIFGYEKLASTVVSLRKQIIQNGAG